MAKNGQKRANIAKNGKKWQKMAIFQDFWHFLLYNSAQKAPKMHFKVSIFQVNYENDKKCAKSS